MISIDRDFSGGNIRLIDIQEDTVFLENELRDTEGDWFYWAFRVKGAAGRTLTFDFGEKAWIGRWGAAVSHDALDWTWGGAVSSDLKCFTYTFGADEDEVYFCHDIRYSPERFARTAHELGLTVRELTVSEKGRSVPYIEIGTGDKCVLLTARHHACESTGTYVMEGIIREYLNEPLEGFRLIAIPFMDFDGAQDGDQGKNRIPHDHNRDYDGDSPIYSTVRCVKALAAKEQIDYMLDLHSPWHISRTDQPIGPENANDCVFVVQKNTAMQSKQILFSKLLAETLAENPNGMQHDMRADVPVNYGWNQDSIMKASCSAFFAHHPKTYLALSLETAYFGLEGNRVTADRLIEEGRGVLRTLKKMEAARKSGK